MKIFGCRRGPCAWFYDVSGAVHFTADNENNRQLKTLEILLTHFVVSSFVQNVICFHIVFCTVKIRRFKFLYHGIRTISTHVTVDSIHSDGVFEKPGPGIRKPPPQKNNETTTIHRRTYEFQRLIRKNQRTHDVKNSFIT